MSKATLQDASDTPLTQLEQKLYSSDGNTPNDPTLSASYSVTVPSSAAASLAMAQNLQQEQIMKRDEILRPIFGEVGDLLNDFTCAVESAVLLHGRMFLTTKFLCFYSNLFGLEKKIRIPLSHIKAINKENTALVIPNAISVTTHRKEYLFRSFWDRDECFLAIKELLIRTKRGSANLSVSSSSNTSNTSRRSSDPGMSVSDDLSSISTDDSIHGKATRNSVSIINSASVIGTNTASSVAETPSTQATTPDPLSSSASVPAPSVSASASTSASTSLSAASSSNKDSWRGSTGEKQYDLLNSAGARRSVPRPVIQAADPAPSDRAISVSNMPRSRAPSIGDSSTTPAPVAQTPSTATATTATTPATPATATTTASASSTTGTLNSVSRLFRSRSPSNAAAMAAMTPATGAAASTTTTATATATATVTATSSTSSGAAPSSRPLSMSTKANLDEELETERVTFDGAALASESAAASDSEEASPEEVAKLLEALQAEVQRNKLAAVIHSGEMNLTVQTFCKLFMDDNAPFGYNRYHESKSDHSIELSPWTANPTVGGCCREMKFIKPLRNVPGITQSRGCKLQRMCRFGSAGAMLFSSTRMEDVPAAHTFTVDDMLIVSIIPGSSPPRVKAEIHYELKFVKSTMLRYVIQGATDKDMAIWLKAQYMYMEENYLSYSQDSSSVAGDSTKDEAVTTSASASASASASVSAPSNANTSTPPVVVGKIISITPGVEPSPAAAPPPAVKTGGLSVGLVTQIASFIIIIILSVQSQRMHSQLAPMKRALDSAVSALDLMSARQQALDSKISQLLKQMQYSQHPTQYVVSVDGSASLEESTQDPTKPVGKPVARPVTGSEAI